MTSMDFEDIRDQLVLAALPHAVFDGWSPRVLAQAAAECGFDPSMAERAFMGGAMAVVEHFADLGDRRMAADLAGEDIAGLRVPDRVEAAVMARLRRWSPHREAVRRAMAVLALHPGAAARVTFRTTDAIWRVAGDSSHDFSWYTRRATLAAVYSATVLYWLDDASEGQADTVAFLKRRLAGVGRVTGLRKRLEGWVQGVPRAGRLRRV